MLAEILLPFQKIFINRKPSFSMDWKYFIKPNLSKIILFLILGITLFFVEWWWIPECCDFIYYQGFPLPVYYWGGFVGHPKTFIPVNFVADAIAWYITSAFIFFGFNKFRKK